MGRYTEAASLLITLSTSSSSDKKTAVRITNTTESPYSIKKYTKCRIFRSHSNFIKPVDTAIPNMMPEGDPDLTIYLNELLKTNNPEQHNKILVFDTQKIGQTEDHSPKQTRILREPRELKKKQKLNSKYNGELRMNFREGFDWIDTSQRNRKSCSGRHPRRLPWHICQI